MRPLNPEEQQKMRVVGQLAGQTLKYLGSLVKAGMTTNELDKLAYEYTMDHGATPAPLGYNGFPKSICTSVNECICHGVPDDRPLQDGDILNIDVTSIKDGFYGDTSSMFTVGDASEEAKAVIQTAYDAMWKGIEAIRPFGTTGDIGFATNRTITRKGFFGVKEIGGHGIGRVFHTDPFVPSFGKKGKGEKLMPWTCLTVEPMINQKSTKVVEFDIPGSTVKYYETPDKSLSAQFEHTILITDQGYEILTLIE